jgi:predicted nucleic acid-binding protein
MDEPALPLAYIDANVFIDLVEGLPELSRAVEPLFTLLQNRAGLAVTSEVTLAEVLAPTKSRDQAKPELRVYYLDLLTSGRFVDLHPVSRDILYDTSSLRERGPLRLVDAIHLATAMRAGCSFLVSRDAGFGRFSTLIEIAAPGSPAFQQLIAALS